MQQPIPVPPAQPRNGIAIYRAANVAMVLLPGIWLTAFLAWTQPADRRDLPLLLAALLMLALPFAVISWIARRSPPSKSALAMSAGMALLILIPACIMLFSVLTDGTREWDAAAVALLVALAAAGYLGLTAKIYLPIRSPRDWRFVSLIVLTPAAVLVLAALVVPNFMRSCCASSEATSVSSIRTINTAEVTYLSTYPKIGFACSLGDLGPGNGSVADEHAAGLIDSVLAGGVKSGYAFRIVSCGPDKYQAIAEPLQVGKTGQRAFCTDQSGVIRISHDGSGAHCLASGEPLQ